jgi:hypothetical protein
MGRHEKSPWRTTRIQAQAVLHGLVDVSRQESPGIAKCHLQDNGRIVQIFPVPRVFKEFRGRVENGNAAAPQVTFTLDLGNSEDRDASPSGNGGELSICSPMG